MLRKSSQNRDSLKKPFLIHAGVKLFPIGTHPFFGAAAYPCGQFDHMVFLPQQVDKRPFCKVGLPILGRSTLFVRSVTDTSCRQTVHMRSFRRSPCIDFLPPSGGVFRLSHWGASPGIPCRRSRGFQGPTGKTATKKPSQKQTSPAFAFSGRSC